MTPQNLEVWDATYNHSYSVSMIIMHSEYSSQNPTNNDIALHKLSIPFIPYIEPAEMSTNADPKVGDSVTVSGWGRFIHHTCVSWMLSKYSSIISTLYLIKSFKVGGYAPQSFKIDNLLVVSSESCTQASGNLTGNDTNANRNFCTIGFVLNSVCFVC